MDHRTMVQFIRLMVQVLAKPIIIFVVTCVVTLTYPHRIGKDPVVLLVSYPRSEHAVPRTERVAQVLQNVGKGSQVHGLRRGFRAFGSGGRARGSAPIPTGLSVLPPGWQCNREKQSNKVGVSFSWEKSPEFCHDRAT